MERKFEAKPKIYNCFEFAGVTILKTDYGFIIHQSTYASTLKELTPDATYDEYCTIRYKLAWLLITCPETLCNCKYGSQVTKNDFNQKLVKNVNKVITRVKDTSTQGIRFHTLEISSLSLISIRYASFANNADLSSRLGHITLLTDQSGRANINSNASYKSRCVVLSILYAETYSFADCFDGAYNIRDKFKQNIGKRISLAMLTDSACLFNVIAKSSRTTERRLMIDLASTKEAYNNMDIDDIG